MSLTNYICGMGNPLLDISVDADDALLNKYELKMNNAILAEEKHLPLYPEICAMPDPLYVAGGATQNAIRVAQWLLPEGSTNFMGCIGNGDAYGAQLVKCLQDAGVGEFYQKDEKAATGTCAVLIKDQERSLCANLSAANNFKASHLEVPEVKAMWQAASFYYIGGFFFTVSQESIMAVARHAHENGKTLAINLSAPFIPQFFAAGIAEVMPYVDIVIGNESEAEAYGLASETKDPEAVARMIAALPKANASKPRVVVITQGADRTIVATDGNVQYVDVPPVPKAEIIDSNGAGDAFVGGFISQYVQGKSLQVCCEAGHYTASNIIRVSGCVVPSTPHTFRASE
jgi:adenosine kinase